ncbi:uncharacterized protein LOC110270975 [Arachis ipaensis]|uniref:uncharacterized protein LOC110270975 n=1 Tax=Arachis ipaensis TaxID=130454 RepID=UPI000A2B3031|nr:uncharacterized protein LOC110270975 [Arachis ipaensis]
MHEERERESRGGGWSSSLPCLHRRRFITAIVGLSSLGKERASESDTREGKNRPGKEKKGFPPPLELAVELRGPHYHTSSRQNHCLSRCCLVSRSSLVTLLQLLQKRSGVEVTAAAIAGQEKEGF